MLSLRRHFTRAITLAILCSTALADVVVLKTGEKVEGKITQESDQQVTLEVKISAGITDERVIPRGEIERIDKVSPEAETFKAINTIQLGNNSLSATQYDPAIRTLEAYIKQYPSGVHTAEVQNTLNDFQTEKKRVEGGEAKLRGQWLSRAEVAKEKIQIGGSLSLEQMKNLSAAGDNIGALNTFLSVEKIYGTSMSMPDMIELARQLTASIKPVVDRAIPEQKILKARKEQGFANAGVADRAEMMAAYKAEMAQAEATVAAAVTAHQWPPFIATNDKCLTALSTFAGREATRLAALPLEKIKQSVELTESARQSISLGDLESASVSLKQAISFWSPNELAQRLAKDVTTAQKEKDPKNNPEAAAPETATPTPKPATPKPSAALKVSAPAAAPVEDSAPFFMTLPGAIGIVVTIAAALVGVNVYKKMKARKESPEA